MPLAAWDEDTAAAAHKKYIFDWFIRMRDALSRIICGWQLFCLHDRKAGV